MDLTVATFNIRNGRAFDGLNSWPFRRGRCAAAIASLDADVVGLQEAYACQIRSLQRRLPGYEFVGEGRNGGRRGEHTPVLVRDHTVERCVTRWFEVEGSRFPRIATTASFGNLHFTSTHLDEASIPRRNASAAQLVDWLDELPGTHIVVGDFNAEPNASLFATFGRIGLHRVAIPETQGTSHHFTGRADGTQIDHILVGPGVEVLDASVAHVRPGGRLPSDHWPVVARLRLPADFPRISDTPPP